MELEIVSVDVLDEEQKKGIWELLKAYDREFIPPLSARNSAFKKIPSGILELNEEGPVVYFNEILNYKFVLALLDRKIVGFMSYIPDHVVDVEGYESFVAEYASTAIVTPECRGHGAMQRFYQAIIDENPGKNVATRTWSGNAAHLHVLEKHGFELYATLKDDRGPGIDTVYYIRRGNK
ncbi:MAG: GNAT family N-acetyltransferase [Oscillospiraceae bacterium]|nr:GNAT family N-acetyltransferase [Oscillospiraceae bacterium]